MSIPSGLIFPCANQFDLCVCKESEGLVSKLQFMALTQFLQYGGIQFVYIRNSYCHIAMLETEDGS